MLATCPPTLSLSWPNKLDFTYKKRKVDGTFYCMKMCFFPVTVVHKLIMTFFDLDTDLDIDLDMT